MTTSETQFVDLTLFENTKVAFSSQSNSKLRKTFWLFALMNKVWIVNLGTFFIKLSFKLNLPIKSIIRFTIFEQFCGGENIENCQKTAEKLGKAGVGTILDYSVEGRDDDDGVEATFRELLRTIDFAAVSSNIPFTVFKVTGMASADLLERIQSKEVLGTAEKKAYQRLRERVQVLCRRAKEKKVRIFIDAEESWIQEVIDDLANEMMEELNREEVVVYNTYQLYKEETLESLKDIFLRSNEKGFFVGAKLVRGAYLEKERLRASEHAYCDPVHKTKADTDKDYNAAVDFCLDRLDKIAVCLGTHNEYSVGYCITKMQRLGLQRNDHRVWFAQLYGMSDNISFNLADAGYNVAKYVPYGPVEDVMPYLFRRAEENKAIAGQSSREFLLVKSELKRRNEEGSDTV